MTAANLPGGKTSARSLIVTEIERAEVARRLMARSVASGDCLLWQGTTTAAGYGEMSFRGMERGVHRLAYATWVDNIPEGMTVDHICFAQTCIRPDHLRLATNLENSLRQRSRLATACRRGHPFDEQNTAWDSPAMRRPRRRCRACRRIRDGRT